MRRAKTLSQILSDPSFPQRMYWRSFSPSGAPSVLTIAGKAALAILEANGVPLPQCIEVLGLRGMSVEAFELFRKLSAIDQDLHRKHAARVDAERAGKWVPGLVEKGGTNDRTSPRD